MLSIAIGVLATAVLCWPAAAGRPRLARLTRLAPLTRLAGQPGPGHGVTRRGASGRVLTGRRGAAVLVAVLAGMGALLAGAGGALAALMAGGTAAARWRAGSERRTGAAAATGLADALTVLAAQLRAGTHPGAAAAAAAIDAHPEAGRALSVVASAARLGGDIPAALRAAGTVALRPWLGRLADAWSMAQRHGIPLADLLDAVRADTEARVRFATELQARLAGPRATAAVLAGLPLLGLALGQAVGAAPLRVLASTGTGQCLLVVGTALACAGVLWSARLTDGVARS